MVLTHKEDRARTREYVLTNWRNQMSFLNKFRRDEEGATAIEYGLIAALIAVAAISAMSSLGDSIEGTMNAAGSEMDTAVANAAANNGG